MADATVSAACLVLPATAMQEVIRSGKLPLLELEGEGVEMMKAQGIDCLKLFLKPPSSDVFQERLHDWLKESDKDIAARQVRLARYPGGLSTYYY